MRAAWDQTRDLGVNSVLFTLVKITKVNRFTRIFVILLVIS
jgi:hypothetical protein